MGQLKLEIIPDLNRLSRAIREMMKKAFDGVGRGGGGGGADGQGGQGKKQVGLLGMIFRRLLPIGVLLKLKPIADLLNIILGLITFGLLKLFQWYKKFADKYEDIRKTIKSRLVELRKGLRTKLTELKDRLKEKLLELKDRFVERVKELRDRLKEKLIELKDKFVEKFTELKDKFVARIIDLKNRFVAKVRELKDKFVEKFTEMKDRFVEKVLELKDRLVEKFIELKDRFTEKLTELIDKTKMFFQELPGKIWDKMKSLGKLIAQAINNLIPRVRLFGFSSKSKKVGDAILRPNGQVIETDPRDTIVAFKGNTPPGGGSGSTFNFYGMTWPAAIDMIKRELGKGGLRSSRI